MFENFFKEYLPRSYSMQGETGLQLTYFQANLIGGLVCAIMAGVFLYYYFFHRSKGMFLYLPLGLFFAILFLICFLNILALWHNYLWITTTCWSLWSLDCLWIAIRLPQAQTERRKLRDCDSLRQEYEALKRQAEHMQAVIQELKTK